MTIETARASQAREGEPEARIEAKIPDEAVNVLELAVKAIKKVARRHGAGSTSN